ncbi:MAG TPA: Na+/H+ antiporter NhaA [Candidatus Babeliales bacterium]|jgi:Na+:H+ antiporter, NhaA family|nr:Na+/H+ antiporter NhaA [Candidatus Babeliales bacterium]
MPARFRKFPLTIFQRFFRTETLGGLVLLGFGLAALAIANSPLSAAYNHLWEIPLTFGIVPRELSLSLHNWINDGLMAVFFLMVGLEIKRELLAGELSSAQQAALPIACAIGGMVVPALIYLIFNLRGPGAHGWGIPMATDIAFALGALNLIAPQAPIGAKVLLTAVAIVDDMGSVLVIALFYSHGIVWSALGGAAMTLLVLIGLNLIGIRHLWPYLLGGVVLWCFVRGSGVHATIAGVALAFTIPAKSSEDVSSPLLRLEHALHNFSAFVVMPLFAFANAGVKIDLSLQHAEIGFGILAGLLLGKPVGIMIAALIAVKTGVARLPQAVNWGSLLGYGFLAGIGFTMSLFIAMLAFDDMALVNAAKRGIIVGSLLAGVAGALMLRTGRPLRDAD